MYIHTIHTHKQGKNTTHKPLVKTKEKEVSKSEGKKIEFSLEITYFHQ
jgi:hypothetical protein